MSTKDLLRALTTKFVRKEQLEYYTGKIKTYVTNAVNGVKTTVGNYTVNGKKISTNPTLSKADVGLANVDNVKQIPASEKGSPGGVAVLDENGHVPSSMVPGSYNDVLIFHGTVSGAAVTVMSLAKPVAIYYDTVNKRFVATDSPITGPGAKYYSNWAANDEVFISVGDDYGESTDQGRKPAGGKLYVDALKNNSFFWSGSDLVQSDGGIALGETSSTAFRGDWGKIAYDHAMAKGNAASSGLYKVTVNAEGHVTAVTAVTKADITALGIPGQDTDTTYGVVTASANGLMSPTMLATLNSALQAGDIQFVTDAEIDAMWA